MNTIIILLIEAGGLRIPPPPPLMRLGPGRPVPQTRLPLPPPQLPAPPGDEYAGLMTQKEKQWLASIQLMQLSTNNPFQDDYYYLVYIFLSHVTIYLVQFDAI